MVSVRHDRSRDYNACLSFDVDDDVEDIGK